MTDDALRPVGLDRARLFRSMKERELDALLLSSPENVFYTTGYPALASSGNPIVFALRGRLPSFVFVGRDERITLLCWGGAWMGLEYEIDDVRPFFTREMAVDVLSELVDEELAQGGTVGVEWTLPLAVARQVQERAPAAALVVADDLLAGLRLVKSPAEIARIRSATRIVDQTVTELTPLLRLGMGRLELIREAKTHLIASGADGVDHVTIAFGAANPEVALDEPLEADQIATLDLGAVCGGYVSDNRRLVYTGAVPPGLRELHGSVCRAVAQVGAALRPATTFAALFARAGELYERMGLAPMFFHVGHSLGIEVEERLITAEDQTVLQPGMVLNIELYTPTDDGVMVGDEETYVVTEDEPELLSTRAADIIERRLA
jgi:Xaa-Pro dipeptidase